MYFDSYAAGKRIQYLRKVNGMTQEELAIKLNISDPTSVELNEGKKHRRLIFLLSSGRLFVPRWTT